jgi:hypothetical protein
MWAGGPDVPDSVYAWRINDVDVAAGYAIRLEDPAVIYQSRNSCDVLRVANDKVNPPAPNTYSVCLPVAR